MKQNTVIGLVGAAALVVVLIVASNKGDQGEPTGSPSPTASPTATRTASPTVVPTRTPGGTVPVSPPTPTPTPFPVTPTPTPTPFPVTPTPTPTPTPGPALGFSASTYSVNEDGGFIDITIVRTGSTAGQASVEYEAVDGTANGTDYVRTSGMMVFAAGVTSRSFRVTITDDQALEGDETVRLFLSDATGASMGTSSATLTIVDDEN